MGKQDYRLCGLSSCLESQALIGPMGCQRVFVFIIAFRITSSFLMHATSATFFGLPAVRSLLYQVFTSGLNRVATSVAM